MNGGTCAATEKLRTPLPITSGAQGQVRLPMLLAGVMRIACQSHANHNHNHNHRRKNLAKEKELPWIGIATTYQKEPLRLTGGLASGPWPEVWLTPSR